MQEYDSESALYCDAAFGLFHLAPQFICWTSGCRGGAFFSLALVAFLYCLFLFVVGTCSDRRLRL